MNKAMWLGFFFFVAFVLLLYGSLTAANIRFTKPIKIKFLFDQVEGLRKGHDIQVDGVKVGKVAKIELTNDGVRVEGHLDQKIDLHDDCKVFVESFSLIGGNHISITRGSPDRPLLAEGIELRGKPKPSALDEVGNVLSGNRDLIKDMLISIKDTADETRELMKDIRNGQGTLSRLINDPKVFDEALKAVQEFRELAEKINKGTGTLGKLANDPSLYDELRTSMSDLRAMAASARQLVDKISSGQGVLGKLLNDPKMADDVEKMIENLRKSSEDLKKILGEVEAGNGTLGKLLRDDTLVKKAEETLDSVNQVVGRASKARVFVGADYRAYRDSQLAASRLYLRIAPDETKYFQGGVTFLGLTASADPIEFKEQQQTGRNDTKAVGDIFAMYKIPWFFDNHVGLRAGLMEGKAGGGVDVDFKIGDWPLMASFDIRDSYKNVVDEDIDENVHGPMTRAYITAPLWSPDGDAWWKQVLYAFKATAGFSRLQDNPEFFAGFGFEFEDKDIRTLVTLLGLR